MKEVLVIEKLHLITFILTLPFRCFFGKVFCTQITPFLKIKAMARVVAVFGYKIFDYSQIANNVYHDVVRDAYELTEEVYEKIAKEGLVLRLLRKINNNFDLADHMFRYNAKVPNPKPMADFVSAMAPSRSIWVIKS